MSVRYGNGRTKRNLYTPEYTILNFQKVESKAMSPKQDNSSNVFSTLLLMILFSSLSIYGIFTSNVILIYTSIGFMLLISMWICLQI